MRDKIERGPRSARFLDLSFQRFTAVTYRCKTIIRILRVRITMLAMHIYAHSCAGGPFFFFASPSLCADSNCENRKIKESRGKNRADTPQLSGSFPSFLFFAPSSFLPFSFTSPFLQGCQFCGDTVVSLPLSLTLEPLLRRTSFTQSYSPCRAMSINGWSIPNQTVLSATQKNLTFDNSRDLNS